MKGGFQFIIRAIVIWRIFMKYLYERLSGHKNIVIFGASYLGKLLHDEIREYCDSNSKTLCFADNSYKKWVEDRSVIPPSSAAERYPSAVWFVASDRYRDSMIKDLLKLGITEANIISDLPDEMVNRKLEEERTRRLTTKHKLEKLDVEIAHHCNLNCARCSAFSPLVKETSYADIGVFRADMCRLSQLLQGNLGALHIMGGEPLLNPHINEFSKCAREHFPESNIKILTNGLLLTSMPEAFWHTCQENRIMISVTKYPIRLDFDGIKRTAVEHGLEFEFYGMAVEKTSCNLAFDCSGRQEPHYSFANCHMANTCPMLKNGKVSTCTPILNAEFFNSYFNKELHVCPDDYIDIYEAQSGREILEFISKPVPFCRYCDVRRRNHNNPWYISKGEIGEYVVDEASV
jgi:hypothetical protein